MRLVIGTLTQIAFTHSSPYSKLETSSLLATNVAQSLRRYEIVNSRRSSQVSERDGANFPIFSFYERTLSVLGCKYTDDIVINAPKKIDEKFIEEFNIHKVVYLTEDTGLKSRRTSGMLCSRRQSLLCTQMHCTQYGHELCHNQLCVLSSSKLTRASLHLRTMRSIFWLRNC